MEISYTDKKALLSLTEEVIEILSKHRDLPVMSPEYNALNYAKFLHGWIEQIKATAPTTEGETLYRCYATDKPIGADECNKCVDQSCPVVTGFVEGPEKLG